MNISSIVEELNKENGSNYKMAVLSKHKDNKLLLRLIKMTYDKVMYNFYIKKIPIYEPNPNGQMTLAEALDTIESMICTREVTGNTANDILSSVLSNVDDKDAVLLTLMVDRSLKIQMGRSSINKVVKGLITKPAYQRCGIFTSKDMVVKAKKVKGTFRNIKYPAILQEKADGTYREVHKSINGVNINTRQGEPSTMPLIKEQYENDCFINGHYFGELLVLLNQETYDLVLPKLLKKKDKSDVIENLTKDLEKGVGVMPRSIGNGLINSDRCPHDHVYMDVWEYVSDEEYKNAVNRKKNTTDYSSRISLLDAMVNENNSDKISVINGITVNNAKEAMEQTSKWMHLGLEGSIIKNFEMVYKDGTNLEQLKMKLEISLDMRIKGFVEGNKGSKNEDYFSSILFENDEGSIKGRFGVTSLTEEERDWFNDNRELVTGRVVEIECNDITQGSGNDYYALSHPRYITLRDKEETDDLVRAMENKEMAMSLS